MDYEVFIAERIAQLRMKMNISARDMSLSIGQSENYINMIENKKSLPSISAFICICEFLNVSPKEFFEKENKNPKQLNDLIVILKQLDDDDIANFTHLALKIKNNK